MRKAKEEAEGLEERAKRLAREAKAKDAALKDLRAKCAAPRAAATAQSSIPQRSIPLGRKDRSPWVARIYPLGSQGQIPLGRKDRSLRSQRYIFVCH